MKIKLLNNGGYRGFVGATFPIVLDLPDEDFSVWSLRHGKINGLNIKKEILPFYREEAGMDTDDYAGDCGENDTTLYFSIRFKEIEVMGD